MQTNRELTMSEVEDQPTSTPIFALNSASESPIGKPGEILLGIPKQNGTKVDALKVAQTWLPIELTRQIPRAQLLASSEFRHAVESNLLTLISPDYAATLNKQQGAKTERQRIIQAQNMIRQAAGARTISNSGAEITRVGDGGGQGQSLEETQDERKLEVAQANRGDDNADGGLAPAFKIWAERLTIMSDMDVWNALKTKGSLSRPQLRHLKATLTNHPKTVARIKSLLIKSKQAE